VFGPLTSPEVGSRSVLQAEDGMTKWYVAYINVRHEKRVATYLQKAGIESYLPLYRETHFWNKRRAQVELPLFPGYVFVRIPLSERLRVITIPSVVCLVGAKGEPQPLDEGEVNAIRECLTRRFHAEPTEYLASGKRVRIVAGPLCGLEGVIERRNGNTRFIVSIDLIQRSIAVNVANSDLESVEPTFLR
jgi:transcription antitermination factor NusG